MIPKTEGEWGFTIALLCIGGFLIFHLYWLLRIVFRNGRSDGVTFEGKKYRFGPEPYLSIEGEIRYRDSEDNTPMEGSEEPEPMYPAMGLTGIKDGYTKSEAMLEHVKDFQKGKVNADRVNAINALTKPVTGTLKTWPDYFQLQWDGEKTFEIRRNDRSFEEGQLYYLAEYRPDWTNPCPNEGQPFCSDSGQFTGRKLLIRIKYVMHGPCFGLAKEWVAFGYSIVARIAAPEYDEADLNPIL